MPATPNSLINAIPSVDLFEKLIAALSTKPKSELLNLVIKSLKEGVTTHRKVLTKVIADLEKARQGDATEDTKKYDVPSLDHEVRADMNALVTFLKKRKQTDKIDKINQTHSGTEAVGQALLDLAKTVNDDVVKSLATALKKDLAAYLVAKDRVSQGGHAAFEPAVSKTIRSLWAVLDNGFEGLGMSMRTSGTSYDPVYALYPSYKGPLRTHLTVVDPNAKPVAKPKAAKKPKKKATTGTQAAGQENDTTATSSEAENQTEQTAETEPAKKDKKPKA